MAVLLYRREFNQTREVVLHDSSSCTSSSSEDDDLDLFLIEFAFAYAYEEGDQLSSIHSLQQSPLPRDSQPNSRIH